jgi:hypothetical protein
MYTQDLKRIYDQMEFFNEQLSLLKKELDRTIFNFSAETGFFALNERNILEREVKDQKKLVLKQLLEAKEILDKCTWRYHWLLMLDDQTGK